MFIWRNGELADSVEGLYKAFAEYPLPAYTDPCLHCHTMDDEAKLRSKPLRELGLDELRDYAIMLFLSGETTGYSSTSFQEFTSCM